MSEGGDSLMRCLRGWKFIGEMCVMVEMHCRDVWDGRNSLPRCLGGCELFCEMFVMVEIH